MRTRIVNSLTGVTTKDIVGTRDELKYYRVMDTKDRINPQKKFYDNRADYVVHSLFNRFKGKIEHMEGSLRSHISNLNSEWDNLSYLSNKKALEKIEEIICDEPTVTFSYIAGEVQTGWKVVSYSKRRVTNPEDTGDAKE